ncbi:hydrolase [Aureococcus anophagefferens]|nr:hydrolase [Aureococcus anophagefferens]
MPSSCCEKSGKKAAAPAAAPRPPPQQKKERDPAAEAAALRDFGVGCALVDCGANLQSRHGFDETAALDRAALAGVGRVVLTGCDVAGSRSGTWDDATAAELRAIAASPHCVALGECGLDYDRMFSPRETQRDVFAAQCALARDLGKPLWVHVREVDAPGAPLGAYADAIAILGASGLDPRRREAVDLGRRQARVAEVAEHGAEVRAERVHADDADVAEAREEVRRARQGARRARRVAEVAPDPR